MSDNKDNTGQGNAGCRNSGGCNEGDFNSGDYNSGGCNSGGYNVGYRNSGSGNTGNFNAGEHNDGNRNSGTSNLGCSNTGSHNIGHGNAGNRNTGHGNTGDFNVGDFNVGFFCTGTPPTMCFDQPTTLSFDALRRLIPWISLQVGAEWITSDNMTDDEKANYPSHATTGGFLRIHARPLRETFPIAWAKMSEGERNKWLALPNFNAEKFEAITGVNVARKVATVTTVTGEQVQIYVD